MVESLNKIIQGDCLEVMEEFEDESIDTIITDPPAGISFMNAKWDSDKGGKDKWIEWMTEVMEECLRVSKPGATALVWAIPRTSHWTATAMEDAGWEIRDIIMHIFGTGFPKSHSIGKAVDKKLGNEREKYIDEEFLARNPKSNHKDDYQETKGNPSFKDGKEGAERTKGNTKWEGYGTALKPAAEHWIMAMKPKEGTYAENALEHDVAGLNIDGARVATEENLNGGAYAKYKEKENKVYGKLDYDCGNYKQPQGRFPANIITDGSEEATKDMGDKSRYFYCAKASKKERNKGLEEFEEKENVSKNYGIKKKNLTRKDGGENRVLPTKNNHPTVKPLALMEYLVELTKMPNEDQIYLDPFVGSGTTAMAVKKKGKKYIGIEQKQEYCEIARARIDAVQEELI